MKYFIRYALLAALVVSAGCTSFSKDWKKSLPWSAHARLKGSKFETPAHLIAIWTPDVLTQPGKPPTRGFGGRLYFYNEKNQAVPVEGQLMVYGYDDSAHDRDKPGEPQRKFAFTPEQFTKHYGESDLGASYSIWLPWDPAGGEQRSITLVPVFTASSGKVVMGQQAINLLPGTIAQKSKPEAPTSLLAAHQTTPAFGVGGTVQQVSHQQLASDQSGAAEKSGRPRMRTSTISLTPSLSRRVAQAPEIATQPPASAPASAPIPTSTGPIGNPMPPSPATSQLPPGSDPRPAHSGWMRFPAREALTGRANLPAPWTPPYPATPQSALQSAWTPQPGFAGPAN